MSHIISCCNNVFSLWQTDGHRYHDSPLRKISSWIENCTKIDQLILSKIIKIVATSCHILRLKCTNSIGPAPDPAEGAHSAPPDSLTGFKGPTSKGRVKGRAGRKGEGRGRGKWKGGGGRGEGETRRERVTGLLSWKTVSCCGQAQTDRQRDRIGIAIGDLTVFCRIGHQKHGELSSVVGLFI